MKMSGIRRVPIGAITVKNRLRKVSGVGALAQSIAKIGLLNPVLVTESLRLIAGLHRVEACKLLGWKFIPARVLDAGQLEATLAEIEENLVRNELTVLEQAEQYVLRKSLHEALFPDTRKGGRHGNQHTGGIKRQNDNVTFCLDAARKTGKSARTVQRLIRIGRCITGEAKDALRDSPFANNRQQLLKLTKVASDAQSSIARMLASGRASSVREARYRVEREHLLCLPVAVPAEGATYQLISGDFRTEGLQVQPESAALVLSDPPYRKCDLHLFEELAAFAARVLRPNGSLVVEVGHYFLPEIIVALAKHLRYHWTMACVMAGEAKFIQSKNVTVAFKPVLWFTKGSYRGGPVRDVVKSSGSDKRWHDWGQGEGEFAAFVEAFTRPGELVVDPFLGGGTTCVAALRLARRFIGIDNAPAAILATRKRLELLNVPMPLSTGTVIAACAAV